MSKRKPKATPAAIPHPLAQAIREEAAKEAPAEPQSQPIPAPVWSVLRNRGYSVQQIATFLGRHGYIIDPDALAKRLKPRTQTSGQPPAGGASTPSHQPPQRTPAASPAMSLRLPQRSARAISACRPQGGMRHEHSRSRPGHLGRH